MPHPFDSLYAENPLAMYSLVRVHEGVEARLAVVPLHEGKADHLALLAVLTVEQLRALHRNIAGNALAEIGT